MALFYFQPYPLLKNVPSNITFRHERKDKAYEHAQDFVIPPGEWKKPLDFSPSLVYNHRLGFVIASDMNCGSISLMTIGKCGPI